MKCNLLPITSGACRRTAQLCRVGKGKRAHGFGGRQTRGHASLSPPYKGATWRAVYSAPRFHASSTTMTSSRNDDLLQRSRRAVWHPCTQMKHHEPQPLVPIVRGVGAWLFDAD